MTTIKGCSVAWRLMAVGLLISLPRCKKPPYQKENIPDSSPPAAVSPNKTADAEITKGNGWKDVPHEMDLKSMAAETKLTFPEASKIIQFHEPDYFVDPIWVAKISIPASFQQEFKEQLLSKPVVDATTVHGGLAKKTSWWKPMNVMIDRYYWADDEHLVRAVVSEEGKEWTIFIECAVF